MDPKPPDTYPVMSLSTSELGTVLESRIDDPTNTPSYLVLFRQNERLWLLSTELVLSHDLTTEHCANALVATVNDLEHSLGQPRALTTLAQASTKLTPRAKTNLSSHLKAGTTRLTRLQAHLEPDAHEVAYPIPSPNQPPPDKAHTH